MRASALDAVAHGLRVRILTGMIAGVAPASSEAALIELAHAGVGLVGGAATADPDQTDFDTDHKESTR